MELRDNGTLVHDGIVVGKVETISLPEEAVTPGDHTVLVINLGWAKAAGLGVKCLGDPERDTRRTVLDR